jgi:hypothetical protein
MTQLLKWVARLAGIAGVIVCAVALLTRLSGSWTVGAVSIGTVFQLGMASMIVACLAYCAVLAESSSSRP